MTEISLSEYSARPHPTPSQRPTMPRATWIVIGAVVLAGASFFGGIQYQKGKVPASSANTASSSQYGSNGSSGGFGGGTRRGNRAFGTVSSVSGSSITVQTRSGATNTYTITSSTTVTNNGQSGSVSDIQQGDTVILSLDSSNTQDVTSIMLNPSFGGGFGGGAPSSGGSNSGSSSNATGA